MREMTRLDERRAAREERHAERVSALDEDVLFGQQGATIMKRFNRVQKSTARIQVLQLLENIEFLPTCTLGDYYPSNSIIFNCKHV